MGFGYGGYVDIGGGYGDLNPGDFQSDDPIVAGGGFQKRDPVTDRINQKLGDITSVPSSGVKTGLPAPGSVVSDTVKGIQAMATPKPSYYTGSEFQYDPSQFKLAGFDYSKPYQDSISNVNRSDEFRARQQKFLDAMQAQAEGKAPSLAEAQYKAAQEQNLAGLNAALAGQRGLSPAQAQRMIANQGAQAGQQTAQQAALLRMQEQQQAQNQYMNATAQGRQQDLQAAQMLNQAQQYYQTLGYNERQANFLAQMELQKLQAGEVGRTQALEAGVNQANEANKMQMIGGLIGAAGTIGAAVLK